MARYLFAFHALSENPSNVNVISQDAKHKKLYSAILHNHEYNEQGKHRLSEFLSKNKTTRGRTTENEILNYWFLSSPASTTILQ